MKKIIFLKKNEKKSIINNITILKGI